MAEVHLEVRDSAGAVIDSLTVTVADDEDVTWNGEYRVSSSDSDPVTSMWGSNWDDLVWV